MKNKKDNVLKEEPRICNLSNFTFLSNLYFLDWTSKPRRFSMALVSCCLRLYSLNNSIIITDSQLRCLSFLISTREGTRGSSWEDCFAFFLLSREPLLAMKIQRIFKWIPKIPSISLEFLIVKFSFIRKRNDWSINSFNWKYWRVGIEFIKMWIATWRTYKSDLW